MRSSRERIRPSYSSEHNNIFLRLRDTTEACIVVND